MKFYDESKLDLNPVVSGVVALGSSAKQTVGKNKSGKPWKKQQTRSGLHKSISKKSFEKRMDEKKELKILQERTKAIK